MPADQEVRVDSIGVLGGTGPLGRGLGLRLAQAGHRTLIGSRSSDRAGEAVGKLLAKDGRVDVAGVENAEAVTADIVIVALPYTGLDATLPALAGDVRGKVVVSCVNALERDELGPYPVPMKAGSAAETVQGLLPEARVVGAFQSVSAPQLLRVPEPVVADVPLVADDEEARETVAALVERIPGMRPVHAGPLRLARPLEELTAVLIAINRRYKVHAGIRIAGLDD
jgi:8-hydroxy-5-deazaflavin:NADPH oxidoreductase